MSRNFPKSMPRTENSLVLRTDFGDENAWCQLHAALEAPVGQFRAFISVVNDPSWNGITTAELVDLAHKEFNPGYVFVADALSMEHPEHPIQVVDLNSEAGRSFRVVPSAMWGVENNLAIANMGFEEFADNVDADGIFRGFR